MSPVVVDTNVLATADGRATHAGTRCRQTCVDRLVRIRQFDALVLDRIRLILDEYHRNVGSDRQQPGFAFVIWAETNQYNLNRCHLVSVHALAESGQLEDFPIDPDLASFDPSDRKFVAVALGSGLDPPILNATDTDWWDFREPLERHGVKIELLCPELMASRGR